MIKIEPVAQIAASAASFSGVVTVVITSIASSAIWISMSSSSAAIRLGNAATGTSRTTASPVTTSVTAHPSSSARETGHEVRPSVSGLAQ